MLASWSTASSTVRVSEGTPHGRCSVIEFDVLQGNGVEQDRGILVELHQDVPGDRQGRLPGSATGSLNCSLHRTQVSKSTDELLRVALGPPGVHFELTCQGRSDRLRVSAASQGVPDSAAYSIHFDVAKIGCEDQPGLADLSDHRLRSVAPAPRSTHSGSDADGVRHEVRVVAIGADRGVLGLRGRANDSGHRRRHVGRFPSLCSVIAAPLSSTGRCRPVSPRQDTPEQA